jgi:hypothetical protein
MVLLLSHCCLLCSMKEAEENIKRPVVQVRPMPCRTQVLLTKDVCTTICHVIAMACLLLAT